MNLLFEEKIQYQLTEPIENVRSELESLLDSTWHDFSRNLSGTVSQDNTFKVYPKVTFAFNVFSMPQGIALITGKLHEAGDRTHINTVVRANYILVAAFYLVVFFFVTVLIEVSTADSAESWAKLTALFLTLLFIIALVRFSTKRLRRRFEQQMYIRPI